MSHGIQVTGMNHFYGSTQALFDINTQLPPSQVIVLLGASGAGKSTFLRTLNMLEMPSSGVLNIAGETFDFGKGVTEAQLQQLRKRVSMVFQQYHLWPHMSVLKNLTYVPVKLGMMSEADAQAKAKDLMTRLKIQDHAAKYPTQLSGGQQQRVAICRALMMNPEVLLYDEPTAALDPSITEQVGQIIREFRSTGVTQVVVTHDVGFAKSIADVVCYFDHGKLVEQGPASQLFSNPQSPELQEYLSSVRHD